MLRQSLFLIFLQLAWCSLVLTYPHEVQSDAEQEWDSAFGDSLIPPEANVRTNNISLNVSDTLPKSDIVEMTNETLPVLPEEKAGNETQKPLESSDLFEGDLDIPEELINEYYGNDTRGERAAVRYNSRLWPSGKVYYRYAVDVNEEVRNVIRSAIDLYETHTCLRFYYRSCDRDYIEFTTDAMECSSDWIGCKGGKQVIKLGPGCRTIEVVLHEIGHAIGFWHEHTRPDRDYFVTISQNNIESDKEGNFRKRSYSEVDSHGFQYDYGSIMHYSTKAFSRNGLPTIYVNNRREYANQGYPVLGLKSYLTRGDISQINRLYDNCPASKRLRIYARYGINLPDADGFLAGDSDPYMEFVAYDLHGGRLTKKTSTDSGDESPEWYQWLDFGSRVWTKFTAQVWDNDRSSDDALSSAHTWYVYPGCHPDQGIVWSSGGRVYFDYSYT